MRKKPRNIKAYLEEGVLLLTLEFVGTEDLETAVSLLGSKTVLLALEELEDIFDNDGLEVNLFLVVEVLSLQFDLESGRVSRRSEKRKTGTAN